MKNNFSKIINESCSSKIDIVDNHTSYKIRESKINTSAKGFGANFYIFFTWKWACEAMKSIEDPLRKKVVKEEIDGKSVKTKFCYKIKKLRTNRSI